MTDGSVPPTLPIAPRAESVRDDDRILFIDFLRGAALLGILVMNIQSFSMPSAAYTSPILWGDMTGANLQVWRLSYLFADQKFMTIFSMLFGAGIFLMTSRAEVRGPVTGIHYRRMAWLLVFGLLHAYFLWAGDILVTYALCGMIVFWLRRLRPAALIGIAVALLLIGLAVFEVLDFFVRMVPAAELDKVRRDLGADPDQLQKTVDAMRSSYWQQMPERSVESLALQTFAFLTWSLWRVTANMLLGIALLKMDVLSGKRSVKFYAVFAATALVIAAPLLITGLVGAERAQWDIVKIAFGQARWNYVGSIAMATAWIGFLAAFFKLRPTGAVAAGLSAVGKTAFSNYILHTLIATTLFYGHGFGLFGRVERVGQILIVLAIWALQIPLSVFWTRRFLFGPLEWCWRALTYRTLPPMRRDRPRG